MRKRFNLGGGADMGRDKQVPKVPDMNKRTTESSKKFKEAVDKLGNK